MGSIIFSDDFENGLSKWTESGQREWQTGFPDDGIYIPNYPSSNRVAEADDCDDEACILTMTTAIDLTNYSSASLEFWRFVDAGLDTNEYLSVQIGNNGVYTEIFKWTHGDGDDHTWHKESYNLSSYLNSASFTVRILTEQSKSSEDVAVDKINIVGEAKDTVPDCTLNVTAQLQGDDILVSWNDCGEDIRRYRVYIVENDNRGSSYSVYSNTGYTYTRGQEGHTYSFDVKAQYQNYVYTEYFRSNSVTIPASDRIAPLISTSGNLSINASSNSSVVVHYSATAYDSVDGTIPVSCSPSSGSLFAVGNTTVTCTASDAAGNRASKSFTVTVIAPPTDTDGDGYHDGVDNCPNDASSTNNGCSEPACPAGGAAYTSGDNCPEPVMIDSDGDGVTDAADQCPNEMGAVIANGCPFVQGGIFMAFDSLAEPLLWIFPLQLSQHTGTLTIPVEKQDGTTGVIVSAHTITHIDESWGAQDISSSKLIVHYPDEVVISTNIPQLDRIRNNVMIDGDYDFIPVDKKYLKLNSINGTNGEIIVTNGDLDDLVDQAISIHGHYTDDTGVLLYKNVTASFSVIYDDYTVPYTLTDHGIGHYDSTGGDSGAPITANIDGTDKIIGVHAGLGCVFESMSEHIDINVDELSPYYICSDSDRYDQYKLISDWGNVADTFNLK